ncbi:MAG: ABC transporter permease, partial [Phycisphaerae bacterium]
QMIRLLGTRNVIIKAKKPDRGSLVSEANTRLLTYGITKDDLERIRTTIPQVRQVVPMREVAFTVSRLERQCSATVVGTSPELFSVVQISVAAGRPILPYDQLARQKVCVIGDEVRRQLFPMEDPLGQTITVHNRATGPVPYTVVGILRRIKTAGRPARGLGQRDMNRDVYIPLATADGRYGDITVRVSSGTFELRRVPYSDVFVQAESIDHVIPVSQMLGQVMEFGHDKSDYEIKVPLALLQQAEKIKRTRQMTLGLIAAISLLVGGIGIMNIMLATVRERTREIGIRRALGAKQRDIALQFLVETVVLSILGGLIGVGLGYLLAWGASQAANWPTIVRAWTILISFGLSVLVGVFFGMYPAVSAAKLDPIEALRYQ